MSGQFFYNRPLFPAQLNMAHPLTRGLVGCWVLNENSPNSMRAWDSSLYRNNGLVAGGAKGYWQGRFFDAVDDDINLGSSAVFDITTTITILAWIKTSKATIGTIFANTVAPTFPGYIFAVGQDTNGRLEFYDATAWRNSSTVVNNNAWRHVAVTANGTTTKFYVDGLEVASVTGAAQTSNAGNTKYIGQYDNGARFDGSIGEVLVYNRVLVADEVKSLYLEPYAMFL